MKRSDRSSTERIGISSVQLLFEKIGYIFREQPVSDFGIDAHIEVVQENVVTGKLIAAQIKSGVSWFKEATEAGATFRSDEAHLNYWINHSLPVIVILYNPETDTAYWEIVSNDNVDKTPNGWKIAIPFAQKIDSSSKAAFERIAGKSIRRDNYTILSLRDTSHNGAKRYSANIFVESSTRSDILEVVKKATEYIRQRMYYRSEITKQRWGDTPAHVVFLFVYTSIDDLRMTNWICRSLWIDEELPEQFAPHRFKGDLLGGEIIVEWSTHYQMFRVLSQQSTLTKEEYLAIMMSHLKVLSPLVDEARNLTAALNANNLLGSEYMKRMAKLEVEVTKCYMSSTDIGLAPLECKDVSERFKSAIAFAHNVVLPFSEKGLATWEERNRNYLVRRALEDYSKEMIRLEFELEKIR